MPIHQVAALQASAVASIRQSRPASGTNNNETLYAWLETIKNEVSPLLRRKLELQDRLKRLHDLKTSGYKDKDATQALENSGHDSLLEIINTLENTDKKLQELVNDSITLRESMNELNDKIQESEQLSSMATIKYYDLSKKNRAMEESIKNTNLTLSKAIFNQVKNELQKKTCADPLPLNNDKQSEWLWKSFTRFTHLLYLKKPETAQKSWDRMERMIGRLVRLQNTELLLPFLKSILKPEEYARDQKEMESGKKDSIKDISGVFAQFHQTISSEKSLKNNKEHASEIALFYKILGRTKEVGLSDEERFQFLTKGARNFIDNALGNDPVLQKLRNVSLNVVKHQLIQREKTFTEKLKQADIAALLRANVQAQTSKYEELQNALKEVQTTRQRMKQKLKQQAESCVNQTHIKISEAWLALDACKTAITSLLTNKLVSSDGNNQGIFTLDAFNGVLNRHLITEEQLKARLNKNEHLKAASSYKDEMAFLGALQAQALTTFRQQDQGRKDVRLEHDTPLEGLSLIKQESGPPIAKPISHSIVSFAKINSQRPLICHLYPCAD